MTRRTRILALALTVLLLATTIWGYVFCTNAHRAALGARTNLARSREISTKIDALRERPTLAVDQERLSTETTRLIEQAARSAAIKPNKLVRITPEPPRRIADSVYKEKPTQVRLKGVTLTQSVEMLHRLTSAKDVLHPQSIRLGAPRIDDTGDIWTAELVLTYLIYDPPKAGR